MIGLTGRAMLREVEVRAAARVITKSEEKAR
jgi:hypothetical protein